MSFAIEKLPLRPFAIAGILCLTQFEIGVAIGAYMYFGEAPGLSVAAFIAYGVAVIPIWGLIAVWMLRVGHSAEYYSKTWSIGSKAIMAMGNIGCALFLVTMFRYGSLGHRLVAIALLLTFPSGQIVSTPESKQLNKFCVAVQFSLMTFVLLAQGDELEFLFAIFVAINGALLFVASGWLADSVQMTVESRARSERVSEALQHSLDAVAKERDAKTRFIASASHDLSQPIHAAALFVEQAMARETDPTRLRAFEGARQAFSSANTLLSQMLDYLRLESDRVQPMFSSTDLADLLERVAAQYGPLAERAGVTISIARSAAPISTDRPLVERAFGNLVDNAIKHTSARRIVLAARPRGERAVRLWVVDDGNGVDAADAPHVFDDYFQGGDGRRPLQGGFGLGLASVRRIATLLGGQAGLDIRWRRGAAFFIELPREPSPMGAPAASLLSAQQARP